jgi:hypothetical protein
MSEVKYPVYEEMKMYKKQLIYLETYYQFFKKHHSYEDMTKVSLIKKYIRLCRNSLLVMSCRYNKIHIENMK